MTLDRYGITLCSLNMMSNLCWQQSPNWQHGFLHTHAHVVRQTSEDKQTGGGSRPAASAWARTRGGGGWCHPTPVNTPGGGGGGLNMIRPEILLQGLGGGGRYQPIFFSQSDFIHTKNRKWWGLTKIYFGSKHMTKKTPIFSRMNRY